jgi:hypothetical protein
MRSFTGMSSAKIKCCSHLFCTQLQLKYSAISNNFATFPAENNFKKCIKKFNFWKCFFYNLEELLFCQAKLAGEENP